MINNIVGISNTNLDNLLTKEQAIQELGISPEAFAKADSVSLLCYRLIGYTRYYTAREVARFKKEVNLTLKGSHV